MVFKGAFNLINERKEESGNFESLVKSSWIIIEITKKYKVWWV